MAYVSTQTLGIILLGPPGAGKGSQASLVKKKFNIPHISTGDLLRYNIAHQTKLGLTAKGFMDEGNLVPDDLILSMLFDRLKEPDCVRGYILDGFPRTLNQAKSFIEKLSDETELKIISLSLKDEVLLDRILGRQICNTCHIPYHITLSPPKINGQCNQCTQPLSIRSDDQADIIKSRLTIYHEQTAPLVDFFKTYKNFVQIDSNSSKQDVFNQIERFINK